MGRSQETFGKKEIEKKKIKKRQDKQERKEERKASSGKGKSLDEMMAYIDENGNIVDTPPDPSRMKEVNLEDIQISVARQEDEVEDAAHTGTITFFNDTKGYGFIRDARTGESIFVHASALSAPVKERDKVSFEVEAGPKGPNAVRVKLV